MKVRRLVLKKFKRFDDLTVDLGADPARIVALVGPNGCGKSSIFDAFDEKQKDVKSGGQESLDFYSKDLFHNDPALRVNKYNRGQSIQIVREDGTSNLTQKSFHIRSAYRFTSKLSVSSISSQPDILTDPQRPLSSIAIDSRLQENYARMLGMSYAEFEKGERTGRAVREELLGKLNGVLSKVLDVRVSSIGNVTDGRGQLYFEKEDAKDFPYQNLSSGEKEVVDIIVDLVVRSPAYNDTVYCIDEPELHLNTAIQRKLLVEIEKLIPPNCQLWVATHSVGFLRALQDELADKCAVLDFSERNYFQGSHTITPMATTRANWQRIFETALDDLVGLVAPETIIYCEGRADPSATGTEQGLDATVYNEVFSKSHPTTLFISSGGGGAQQKNSSLALKVLSKAFVGVELLLLRDRDDLVDADRLAWLQSAPHHRMLLRREIENYLFDFETLRAYCSVRTRTLARTAYDSIVQDIHVQDLKLGDTIHRLKVVCGEPRLTNEQFKVAVAPHVSGTPAFAELDRSVFTDRGGSLNPTGTVIPPVVQ